jgi:hypothetical protein
VQVKPGLPNFKAKEDGYKLFYDSASTACFQKNMLKTSAPNPEE